jgi:hypothetical protein
MESLINIETQVGGMTRALDELSACVGADSKEMLQVEAGQLAWRIAQGFGPGNYASARTAVQKNIKLALYPVPPKPFTVGKANGTDGTRWLYAGQHFVAGVEPDNNKTNYSSAEALKVYYRAKNQQKYGFTKGASQKWGAVGKRGGQHVMLLDRAMVTPSALSGVIRAIQANIGQAKASFAFTTAQTTHKRIAGWISKHFPTRANGKAIFSTTGLANGNQPFVEIGSRAKGVVSNPKMARAIQNGVKQSTEIIKAKVEKLLNDYAYDFKTGAVFKPKATGFDRN